MYIRFPSMIFGMAVFGALLLPSLQADDWNKKTVITITEPVQLPSCCSADHMVTLQPGTYVIALVDSLSDRHIVRVFEKDEKTVITTILAIPNYRLKPTDKTNFQFWETPAGNPRAMRAWFYPGDNFGQEFAYPKMKSVEIAKITKTAVPTVLVEEKEVDVAVLKTAPVVFVDDSGKERPLKVETLVASNSSSSGPEPSSQPQDAPALSAAKTLPGTASQLPLIGLVGLASLAAFGLMVC